MIISTKEIAEKWSKLAKRPPHYLTEDEWLLIRGFYSTIYIMMIQIDKEDNLEKLNNIYEMVVSNFNIIGNRLDSKKCMLIYCEYLNSMDELLEDYELIEDYKLCQKILDFKKLFLISETK